MNWLDNNEIVANLIYESENVTAQEARRGKDIQGIRWETTNFRSRELFRQQRLEIYQNDAAFALGSSLLERATQESHLTSKGLKFYDFFQYNNCLSESIQDETETYFSGLLWSTSRHDVYFSAGYEVCHWDALTSTTAEILNLEGHVAPSEEHPEAHMEGFTKIYFTTIAVGHKLLVVGGCYGELICKHLDRPGVSFCFKPEVNSQIYSIEIFKGPTGSSEDIHFMASDLDGCIRIFDVETFNFSQIQIPWSVHHASTRPDGKQIVVVGEEREGRLVDSQTGETIQSFCGHLDWLCSSAWHPDGVRFATGSRDTTCRIWDARNLSQSIVTLGGNNIGDISSISFTSDGNFMAMSEKYDYAHVYKVGANFKKEQEIDFFGHVSGLCFSPDTESLFIGVSMLTIPTLLTYKRRRISHTL